MKKAGNFIRKVADLFLFKCRQGLVLALLWVKYL